MFIPFFTRNSIILDESFKGKVKIALNGPREMQIE